MGVQFEWQTGSDDGQWETIARTDRGRWLRRIPRWVWIVLVAVLVASAGGGYVVVRRRYDQARREIEFQIQGVIDLEARAFAQGDGDLFLAQQDEQSPDWYSLQRERIRTNAQNEPILPAKISDVDLRDDVAWVEVIEGEGPVRRARFYRQTDLGWKHTEPRPEFWGAAIQLHYGEIIFRYHKRDQPHVDSLVEHIAQTFFDICAQVGCPEDQSLTVNFAVDAFIPTSTVPPLDLEEDEWLLPSPWLLGLPVDGTWDEALLNELSYAIADELASQAMRASDTFAMQGLKSLILNEYVRWYTEGATAQTPVLSQLIERQGEDVLPRVFDQLGTAQDTGSLDELIADTLALSPDSPGPAFFETLLAIEREAIFAGLQETFLLLQDDEPGPWIAQQQAFHEVLRHGLRPTTLDMPDIEVEDVVVVDDRALVTLRNPLIRVQGYAPQSLGKYVFFTRHDGEWKHSSTGHALFWDVPLSQFVLPLPVHPALREDAGEDVVTITFFSWGRSTDGLVEAFEEQYPHVRINVISEESLSFPFPDIPADTQEAMSYLYQIQSYQIASLADVTDLGPFLSEVAMPGLLYDLTPFMAQDATFDRQDFYPGMLELFRWGNRTWALPVQGFPFLIYYDKDAFDEAGLSYPGPGWSQEEFASLVRQLAMREGGEAARYGFVNCSAWPIARAFVEGRTGPLVDALARPPMPELNEPHVVRAVRWYTDLALEGAMPRQTGPDPFPDENAQDACYRLVEQAKAAMWADVIHAQEFWTSRVNLGAVPFPTGQYPANPWNADGYAMSGGTLYPEESWLWLRYLSQHYRADVSLGHVPARRSAAETADDWSAWDDETAKAIQGAMEHAWAVRLDKTTAALEHAIAEIYAGASVQRALNEAQPRQR
jgi:ABC-type glycerol-3-phosphate transport system substrate-binding protein